MSFERKRSGHTGPDTSPEAAPEPETTPEPVRVPPAGCKAGLIIGQFLDEDGDPAFEHLLESEVQVAIEDALRLVFGDDEPLLTLHCETPGSAKRRRKS